MFNNFYACYKIIHETVEENNTSQRHQVTAANKIICASHTRREPQICENIFDWKRVLTFQFSCVKRFMYSSLLCHEMGTFDEMSNQFNGS